MTAVKARPWGRPWAPPGMQRRPALGVVLLACSLADCTGDHRRPRQDWDFPYSCHTSRSPCVPGWAAQEPTVGAMWSPTRGPLGVTCHTWKVTVSFNCYHVIENNYSFLEIPKIRSNRRHRWWYPRSTSTEMPFLETFVSYWFMLGKTVSCGRQRKLGTTRSSPMRKNTPVEKASLRTQRTKYCRAHVGKEPLLARKLGKASWKRRHLRRPLRMFRTRIWEH